MEKTQCKDPLISGDESNYSYLLTVSDFTPMFIFGHSENIFSSKDKNIKGILESLVIGPNNALRFGKWAKRPGEIRDLAQLYTTTPSKYHFAKKEFSRKVLDELPELATKT